MDTETSSWGNWVLLIGTTVVAVMFLYHVAFRIGQLTGWWSL